MKAKIESTDRIVEINSVDTQCNSQYGSGGSCTTMARVWEGTTENGVVFVAYIPLVQCLAANDQAEFVRDLMEHKKPDTDTENAVRAMDARFIL